MRRAPSSSHPPAASTGLGRWTRALRRSGGGHGPARSCDQLTGLLDRGSLAVEFPMIVRRACSGHTHVALLAIDIDNFKQVNCEFGRSRGDSILVAFSARLCETLRQTENAFRWEGEEFVVAAYGHDAEEARQLAEHLRATVASRPVAGASLTVSIGVALGHDLRDEAGDLMAAADGALRQAKRLGRGQIVLADPAPATELAIAPSVDSAAHGPTAAVHAARLVPAPAP